MLCHPGNAHHAYSAVRLLLVGGTSLIQFHQCRQPHVGFARTSGETNAAACYSSPGLNCLQSRLVQLDGRCVLCASLSDFGKLIFMVKGNFLDF